MVTPPPHPRNLEDRLRGFFNGHAEGVFEDVGREKRRRDSQDLKRET